MQKLLSEKENWRTPKVPCWLKGLIFSTLNIVERLMKKTTECEEPSNIECWSNMHETTEQSQETNSKFKPRTGRDIISPELWRSLNCPDPPWTILDHPRPFGTILIIFIQWTVLSTQDWSTVDISKAERTKAKRTMRWFWQMTNRMPSEALISSRSCHVWCWCLRRTWFMCAVAVFPGFLRGKSLEFGLTIPPQ